MTQNGTRTTRARQEKVTLCGGSERPEEKGGGCARVGYHERRAGQGRGQGGGGTIERASATRVERRSQDVLQALASVRDHKSKSTMRPRRLVASCARSRRCVGAGPCGTLPLGRQQGRTAAAARRRGLGSSSCSHSTGSLVGVCVFFSLRPAALLTLLSPRLACTSLLLGEGRLPPLPPEPGAGPVNDTVLPPPFRPAAGGANRMGGKRGKRKHRCSRDVSLGPPSACLMHDSVATASAARGRKTGPAPAGDGRAGSRKSGVPVVLHRFYLRAPSRPPVDWLLRSSRDQKMGTGGRVEQPRQASHDKPLCSVPTNGRLAPPPLAPSAWPFLVSLRVLQAIDQVTDRSIWANLPRRNCPRVGKSGDATGVWTRSYITFLLSVSGWLGPHIYNVYAECPVHIAVPCINASHKLTSPRSRNLGRGH